MALKPLAIPEEYKEIKTQTYHFGEKILTITEKDGQLTAEWNKKEKENGRTREEIGGTA